MSDLPPPPPPPGEFTSPPSYTGNALSDSRVQRIGSLAKALWILAAIEVPMQLIATGLDWRLSRKAGDFVAGTITEAEFKKAAQSPLSSLAGLLFLPMAVLTIMWMFRMASNLRAIGRTGMVWSPLWAIFGWLVPPCVVYAVPWLMFGELWRASDPSAPLHDESWKRGRTTKLVHAWWVFFGLLPAVGALISLAILFSQFRQTDLLEFARQQQGHVGVNVVLDLGKVAAAAVFCLFVRQLSDRHMRLTREI
jgi:hypothetical protein